ncbi:MAG: sugar phosphate nucleotidyltransferase [Bacillus subtilis]|nr:sugar phosphate nucleotidyltransferase [Bacillus subtilis]
MGIYLFNTARPRAAARQRLRRRSSIDFGKNVIPHAIRSGLDVSCYRFKDYWRDVGTRRVACRSEHGHARGSGFPRPQLLEEPARLFEVAQPSAPCRAVVGVGEVVGDRRRVGDRRACRPFDDQLSHRRDEERPCRKLRRAARRVRLGEARS